MSFKHLNMPTNYKSVNNLKVSEDLLYFVDNELLKDTGISPEKFWLGFSEAVHELAPENQRLIKIRKDLQNKTLQSTFFYKSKSGRGPKANRGGMLFGFMGWS